MSELCYTCIINKNLIKTLVRKRTYFAEQEKRMLSFHIFNDLPNDFWGKVLKPRLPHAISIETLPRGFNRVCEELFFMIELWLSIMIQLLSWVAGIT